MKKLFLLLSVFSLAITGCESDDGADFNSNIKVDGIAFHPAANGGTAPIVSTAFLQGTNGTDNLRFFKLTKNGSDGNPEQQIQVYIHFPAGQTNSSGTYTMTRPQTAVSINDGGSFVEGDIAYDFSSGKVNVTHLSGNNYKLEFMDVHAIDAVSAEEKLVTGKFSGKFDVENIYLLN